MISMRSQMTVTRAIASAGGLSSDSDSSNITVFRREGNETKVIHLNLGKIRNAEEEDLILQVFDIVDVERTGSAEKRIPTFPENMYGINEDKLKLPLRVID
jgi:protein involved in polysaccharide export with SLBB domain